MEKENLSEGEKKVEQTNVPKKKKAKITCFHCRKKLMLMQQIKCNCGHYFCPAHMNRHSHNCTFDIKAEMKTHLEKNNPKMEQKMIKI